MRELEGRLRYINQSLEELLQRASSPLQRYSRHHSSFLASLVPTLPPSFLSAYPNQYPYQTRLLRHLTSQRGHFLY
uniref:Uncharacterized protein n=1 Tax=Picea glauca TaxID=3330 RepID=A0A101M2Q1_PICGL|nr:hypothetical protein ABT39_MTgene3179 [Picea glauca]QHR89072.1 hypothetical protein Q903MT_gene3091 [Picea sitchensis]